MSSYDYQPFEYSVAPELSGKGTGPYPVVIIGAGPVGLSAAIDLALHGVRCVVLDDNDVVSVGSRAICWAKRTLEIFDRLGVGERMVEKGVTWKVGRLFHRDREVYSFDLLQQAGHKMPAFINLQQYHVEQYLVDRCADFPDLIDLRWKNKVTGIGQHKDAVTLQVSTPDGDYDLEAGFAVACDGARSPVRSMLGLSFEGTHFDERFLIADVEMKADFPSERWFWFEPPFHSGQSALLHKQPDNIYRIDLQLGANADAEEESKPERVVPRIKAMMGDRPFELDWVSVYSFQCARLERFVHGRIVFAGDSAHVVSPFGARGGNGGIQDIDNLCWKLAQIVRFQVPTELLETYNTERVEAADENLSNSARATSFMTPKSAMEKRFQEATLRLAGEVEFARTLVNSGRLSVPCSYAAKHQNLGVEHKLPEPACPGAPAQDAPLGDDWLLNRTGNNFCLLLIGLSMPDGEEPPDGVVILEVEASDDVRARYLGDEPQALYLLRPDQHIVARWTQYSRSCVSEAISGVLANNRENFHVTG
ncbi:FAD-dependent monooxygenase [Anderseniella sp. Alg231-50]|uniref:FAD-dependent monooxygenase n=1 Tax=Anderseniella sp. Alg231-50 TaxID=1922226 RepID=UPI000D55EC1F